MITDIQYINTYSDIDNKLLYRVNIEMLAVSGYTVSQLSVQARALSIYFLYK